MSTAAWRNALRRKHNAPRELNLAEKAQMRERFDRMVDKINRDNANRKGKKFHTKNSGQ